MRRPLWSLHLAAGLATVAAFYIVTQSSNEISTCNIQVVPQGFGNLVDVTDDLPIELVFEVINLGPTTVGSFDIHRECQCKLKQKLPQSIPPGGKSQFSMRIIPPVWGVLDIPLKLTFSQPDQGRVNIPLQIRNQSSFARLRNAPRSLTFSYNRGERFDPEFRIRAVEQKNVPPLFGGLRFESPTAISVQLKDTQDNETNVPGIVERVYLYSLNKDPTVDLRSGRYLLNWQFDADSTTPHSEPIALRINAHEPFFASPARLDLNEGTPSGQIHIIRRSKGFVVSNIILDMPEEWPISIKRVENPPSSGISNTEAVFDVAMTERSAPFQGRLRFNIDGEFQTAAEAEIRFSP